MPRVRAQIEWPLVIDVDVAIAVDRFSQATGLEVRRINHPLTGAILSEEYVPLSRFIDAVNPQRLTHI